MPRVQLPSKINTAFSRMAFPESLKACIALSGGSFEHVAEHDDFLGSPVGTWPLGSAKMYPATVGTGTEVIGVTAALGGTLTGTTGGTNGNGAYQYFGLNWTPANGIYAFWRAKMTGVATTKFEIGLTDSLTNEGIIAVKATPTFTCTDGAAFVFDTNHNTSLDFITCKAGAVGANAVGIPGDTAYHNFEIVVSAAGFASGYVDGTPIGGGMISAAATLGPQIVGATTRATATRTTTCDFWAVVGSRS